MIYMKTTNRFRIALMAMLPLVGLCSLAQDQPTEEKKTKTEEPKIVEKSIVDEVIWVVGDEAILKSDVEEARLQAEQEGAKWNGDPDCVIPEQIAVQKLFLHQASGKGICGELLEKRYSIFAKNIILPLSKIIVNLQTYIDDGA